MTGLYVASNSTALSAQFGLVRNMGALGDTLTRLSTGLKLNSGKDDPAGLIASELLKAQITGTNKAITNTQRANSLIATADSSMAMIGNLLNDIKGLTVEAANTGTMTSAQLAANQMQVDAALDSIDRIARTTNYGGKKILDGSLGFQTAGMGGGIGNVQINSANFGTANAVGVNVNVQQAADYARLISNGTGVSVDTVLDVVGSNGSATVTLGAGATNDEIAAAINRSTDSTGVLAYVEGKEERGSITLSSTGSGNDIVITAREMGFDAGNYDFRITRGNVNDVRIVSEPEGGKAGVVEISLVEGTENRYNSFAGLFDITVDTSNGVQSSVNMTRGESNKVVYSEVASNAVSNVIEGKSLTASVTAGGSTSLLNGWTVVVDNTAVSDPEQSFADLNTKTLYVNTGVVEADLTLALSEAIAKSVPGDVDGAPAIDLKGIGIVFGTGATANLANGDRFTFANGTSAGEINITYKEGATADDILKMLNASPNVSAQLASGVKGTDLIKNIPDGKTYARATENLTSRYTSGASAQQVIDLINSKLGDKFIAEGLASDKGTGGRVNFMDASAIWGDVNMGNALRFTGMDNGPIVRLTNLGTNGQPVANQQLGVNIIHPSEADIKAGIHTPILEIKLATDAQGNSITTASDIAKLFNSLTPEQTMGVSVSQLYPPGVDPNGRVFGTDDCGKAVVIDTCPTPIDGIVQPTGLPGLCGPDQGDLVLLGGNQMIVNDNAVARVAGNRPPQAFDGSGTQAIAGSVVVTANGGEFEFDISPAGDVLGTLTFTTNGTGSSYNAATGVMNIEINPADITAGMSQEALGAVLLAGMNSVAGAPTFTMTNDTGGSYVGAATLTAISVVTEGDDPEAADEGTGNATSGSLTSSAYTGETSLTFSQTSALNGLTFGFTREEGREGFDEVTGTLTIFLGSQFGTAGDATTAATMTGAFETAVNDAIAANWENIRAYTGATGDAVRLLGAAVHDRTVAAGTASTGGVTTGAVQAAMRDATASDAVGAIAGAGKTHISSSYLEHTAATSSILNGVFGTRGIAKDDPVLTITAKDAGTHMAGISIHFVNDTNSGLKQWNEAFTDGVGYLASATLPDIKVDFVTKEDGSRELIITGNLGSMSKSEIDAGLLAKALNANAEFKKNFEANALQFANGDALGAGTAGSVLFNTDVSKPSATTVGGYRIDSGEGVSTSSGIGLIGQSDDNQRLVIESEVLGSEQFVQVNVVSGYLNTVNAWGENSSYAAGQDMLATINGIRATTQGNHISINTGDLSVSMDVANGVGSTGFTITGGGALFQLGPDVVSQQQIRVGIGSMMTSNLGGRDGQLYMLRSGGVAALDASDGSRKLADKIVNQAIENVAMQRARLGATQRGTLEPNIMALQDSLTAMTEANALITNADFAVESSNLTRLQLLIQTGMQTLGIANQMPQYAAQLVR